jgi:uncharacterized membrane protein (UPF0182 family)
VRGDYVAKDLPPIGPLEVTRPEIYFGQASNDQVLVPSAEQEFDYPKGGDNVRTSYRGSHGVQMDGGNRLLWSMRTGDFNLLTKARSRGRNSPPAPGSWMTCSPPRATKASRS